MDRIRTAIALIALCAGVVLAEGNCPEIALEKAPTLISDLEPLKRTVRSTGYSGRIIVTITVTESGSVRDPKIKQPARLASNSKILDQVRALRFCPAVKFSQYTAAPLELSVEVTEARHFLGYL
jgi:hypothetical protein